MVEQNPEAQPAQTAATPTNPSNRGIVYILTNPAMEGYVKVGITSGTSSKDVIDRMRSLDSTGVPRAFNCEYAAVVENYQQVEESLLTGFGENRVRPNREFIEGIPPFRVKAILKMREIEDVTPNSSADATNVALPLDAIEKPVRTPSFKFSMAGMSPGGDLQWADDSSITCRVVADNLRVEYNGEEFSLSRLTAHLKGWNVHYAQVGPYWLYQGKTLDEWRDEFLSRTLGGDG